jgi:23S rRNA (guanosine2251-2'-O)-methyltransferase
MIKKPTKNKQSQSHIASDDLWLYGKHPSFTTLEKNRRKIFEILATKNAISDLEKFIEKKSLKNLKSLIKLVDPSHIEAKIGLNQVHQGLALRVSKIPLKSQFDLLEELHGIEEGSRLPTLLMLDQISDPHNVGAIIRSAAAFGVKKIIFCEHQAPKENATIAKSSAGTLELVDLYCVTNLNNLIEKLKKIGYWCAGLAGEGKVELSKLKEYKNIALIVGSEGSGMRDLVKKNCDLLVKIKIDEEVESLNASVATSIALFELSK